MRPVFFSQCFWAEWAEWAGLVRACAMALLLCLLFSAAGCNGDGNADDSISAEVEPNTTLEEANLIPVGRIVMGSVQEVQDPNDFYIFTVPATGTYSMTLEGFGQNELALLLYDEQGLPLASSLGPGPSRSIVGVLDLGRTYFLEVRAVSAPAATGYTLLIQASQPSGLEPDQSFEPGPEFMPDQPFEPGAGFGSGQRFEFGPEFTPDQPFEPGPEFTPDQPFEPGSEFAPSSGFSSGRSATNQPLVPGQPLASGQPLSSGQQFDTMQTPGLDQPVTSDPALDSSQLFVPPRNFLPSRTFGSESDTGRSVSGQEFLPR